MRDNERGRRWTFFSSPVIIEKETQHKRTRQETARPL